ncbi:MAG TPA: alkaline phosphatase family protein, partial [Candidatus Tumulicola sp.]|nr:alkaline phosphatase family protein [Candidatus Tumulicola sp.]
AFALSACAGNNSVPGPQAGVVPAHTAQRGAASSPIEHVVIIVQENRSFDNLFATFPGANGATQGKMHNGNVIPLKEKGLPGIDVNHDSRAYNGDYDGGKMDGFDLELFEGRAVGKYPYQYVNPADIAEYWTLAQQYALADAMFQTQGSGSFTAHQDLIAGATAIDSTDSLIDYPNESTNWGCGARTGTKTSLITTQGQYLRYQGPFPCLTYPTGTMRDLLDAAGVSWKYYTPAYKNDTVGALWDAFAAIQAVRKGPEWNTNISKPETNVLTDAANGTLPAVSWVIPDQIDSDHPHSPNGQDDGPSWVANVVNAIGGGSDWNSTAIVILWDDWGGYYDHVPPPFFDNAGGLGFRVPMIVVSPYVKAGTIAHTQYEFGSILKFVEQTFNLGSLGTTDVRATSIGNVFNFKMRPRRFHPIATLHTRAFFLHHPPDDEPVDTQ